MRLILLRNMEKISWEMLAAIFHKEPVTGKKVDGTAFGAEARCLLSAIIQFGLFDLHNSD